MDPDILDPLGSGSGSRSPDLEFVLPIPRFPPRSQHLLSIISKGNYRRLWVFVVVSLKFLVTARKNIFSKARILLLVRSCGDFSVEISRATELGMGGKAPFLIYFTYCSAYMAYLCTETP